MLAAERGQVEIARLVLEAGISKELQDIAGSTALVISAEKGYVEIARLLLEAGVNKAVRNHRG